MIFVFWANQATKNRVFLILDKKECFLDQKKEVFKNSNQWKFLTGLVHGFCQTIELFIMYVFWANEERKDRSLIF